MLTRAQRDKWAEELESGRWKQGRNVLYDGTRYCCLGVLSVAVLGNTLAPNNEGSESIHIDCSYPILELGRDIVDEFVALNDIECARFCTIAKRVRALPTSDGEPGERT